MPPAIFLLAIPIFALVVWAIIAAHKAEQKRQAEYSAWATEQGWRFTRAKDRDIYHQFRFLDGLNRGSNRYAFNTLTGDWQGYPAIGFTFHYQTTSTDSKGRTTTHHHNFGVVAIQIEASFPELQLKPESWLSRLGHALGAQDIDFESIEFSKAFEVKSEDKKLAYDFCHTGMMEYLLRHRDSSLELDGTWLAIFDRAKLEPNEIEPYLGRLLKIRQLMPEYLFRG
jgi:hypothetical protein